MHIYLSLFTVGRVSGVSHLPVIFLVISIYICLLFFWSSQFIFAIIWFPLTFYHLTNLCDIDSLLTIQKLPSLLHLPTMVILIRMTIVIL